MTIGLLGVLTSLVVTLVALTIGYYVIRFAVRDGVIDAQRRMDGERMRSQLRLGEERSPNSRS